MSLLETYFIMHIQLHNEYLKKNSASDYVSDDELAGGSWSLSTCPR